MVGRALMGDAMRRGVSQSAVRVCEWQCDRSHPVLQFCSTSNLIMCQRGKKEEGRVGHSQHHRGARVTQRNAHVRRRRTVAFLSDQGRAYARASAEETDVMAAAGLMRVAQKGIAASIAGGKQSLMSARLGVNGTRIARRGMAGEYAAIGKRAATPIPCASV